MRNATSNLLTYAVLGILSAPSCAGKQPAGVTTPTSSEPSSAEKSSCGNHEPGKCAGIAKKGPATSDKPLSISRTETIAPGKHVEVNLSFPAAVPAKATFNASGVVGWNVHSHPSGGMVEHQKGESSAGSIEFQPPAPGVYSFMWKNAGTAPVTLTLTVNSDRGVMELQR